MSDTNLRINLEPRLDADGKKFYIAKLKGPFVIDCSAGTTFLIFTSDEGGEELQIAPMLAPRNNDNKRYNNERSKDE